MPDDTTLSLQVGRLDGRLGAVENRVDRYENMMTAKLAVMDAKLDGIAAAVAQRAGERVSYGAVARFAMWAVGLSSGWLYALTHMR